MYSQDGLRTSPFVQLKHKSQSPFRIWPLSTLSQSHGSDRSDFLRTNSRAASAGSAYPSQHATFHFFRTFGLSLYQSAYPLRSYRTRRPALAIASLTFSPSLRSHSNFFLTGYGFASFSK